MPIPFPRRTVIALAASVLLGGGAVASTGTASAAPAPTAPVRAVATTMTSASLLQLEDLRSAGLVADSAELGTRGDQLLGDAGRFDEGCLGEKTMRNITGEKEYPAPTRARAYVDGVWTSTQDKDLWVNESVAEGRTTADTDHYVKLLLDEVAANVSCQQDPAQGHRYGRAQHARAGSAHVTYFLDRVVGEPSDGGGVAVIRDGRRFGYVSLMFGHGKPGTTLKQLSTAAAANLR